jgi:hypothetical protein
MAKIIPITEHYQHFWAEMKESFWGDLYGHTKLAWKRPLEAESEWERDHYAAREFYQRRSRRRQPYRNGYYERDFVTRLGTIPAAHSAHAGEKLSAAGAGTVSAAGRGCGHADPGGVFAWHLDPASGAGGGHADRRSGKSTDGIEVDPRPVRRGETVSSGAAGRRLGL